MCVRASDGRKLVTKATAIIHFIPFNSNAKTLTNGSMLVFSFFFCNRPFIHYAAFPPSNIFVTQYCLPFQKDMFLGIFYVVYFNACCASIIRPHDGMETHAVVIIFVSSTASTSNSTNATHAIAPPANPKPTGNIGMKVFTNK